VQGQHFAAELKKRIKSIVTSPTTEPGIGKLRSTILTSRHKQRHYLALAQEAKRRLKQTNGVLLHAQRGAYWNQLNENCKK